VIREAVARRLHVLVGGIDAANTASRELHRRFGFAHVGTVREAGFKFDRWLDLEFWQRILPNNDPRYLAEASYTRGSS
jgi:phosphinothricin acetyltransferase